MKDTTYADTSVINSAMGVIDENKHMKEKQMDQEAYKELEEAEKKREEKYRALFRKLDNEDVEQEELSYPYTKSKVNEIGIVNP